MKKVFFAFALTTLFLSAGCSGDGAYTEEEKQTQDSADDARVEDGFDALIQQDSGTSASDTGTSNQ